MLCSRCMQLSHMYKGWTLLSLPASLPDCLPHLDLFRRHALVKGAAGCPVPSPAAAEALGVGPEPLQHITALQGGVQQARVRV
jgi:hypothetical protein